MPTTVPLTEFAVSTDAVILADSGGTVRLLNGSASSLLGFDQSDVIGKRCWEIMGLHSPDGKKLCGRHCGVQQSFLANETCVKHTVARRSCDGKDCLLDLLSLRIPPASNGRFGVLHVIIPRSPERPRPLDPRSVRRSLGDTDRLKELTPRETQILEAISIGESTASIASRLCISTVTVRNHVRAILRKLGVHSRLHAVLLWMSRLP